jgi:hypothetical protein
MRQKKQKKLIYKLAKGVPEGTTLQEELTKALQRKSKVTDRLETLGIDSDEARFINNIRPVDKMLFCELARFTRGAAAALVNMVADKEEWEVNQIVADQIKILGKKLQDAPDEEEGESEDKEKDPQREFLDGILFFGAWKNHVVMLQSAGCKANQLEEHINWLLNPPAVSPPIDQGTGTTPMTNLILLADLVPADIRNAPFKDVEKVTLRPALESRAVIKDEPPQAVATEVPVQAVKTAKFKPDGEVWKALKSIFKSISKAEELSDEIYLDDALKNDSIKVKIELYCSKRETAKAGELMNQIATAFRNVEEDIVGLKFSDGKEMRGKMLKVGKVVSLECYHNFPVMHELHKAMLSYLEELKTNGTLIEDEPYGNVR